VRIRRRNPCVLARRRLFGWNVRLLTRLISSQGAVSEGAGRGQGDSGLTPTVACGSSGTRADEVKTCGSSRPRFDRLTVRGTGYTVKPAHPAAGARLSATCGEPLDPLGVRLLASAHRVCPRSCAASPDGVCMGDVSECTPCGQRCGTCSRPENHDPR
jgi:hypothetical protein